MSLFEIEHSTNVSGRFTKETSDTRLQGDKSHLLTYMGWFLGSCTIVFALISFVTNMNLLAILDWLAEYFSASFTVLYFVLLSISGYCIYQLNATSVANWIVTTSGPETMNESSLFKGEKREHLSKAKVRKMSNSYKVYLEAGMQAANGISTLALTYTLFGISLGIGALAQESLSPDNINRVISILTSQFSIAFMTTVIGLPTAAIVRAWIAILHAKKHPEQPHDA